MSNFDRNYAAPRGVGVGRAAAIDAGLRAYMLRVYNYMAVGVALTGVAAYAIFQMAVANPAFRQTLFGTPLYWVLLLAPLGLVFFLSYRIEHLAASTARARSRAASRVFRRSACGATPPSAIFRRSARS